MLLLVIARRLFFCSHFDFFFFFLHHLVLTLFLTSSGIIFIGLINYVFMKNKWRFLHVFRMKTNKLGGFSLHGCVFFPSSPLTSAELTSFSGTNCSKTTDRKKKTPNPIASPAFLWITKFEYCKEHTQEEEEGVKAGGGGGLYKVDVISVAGPLETPSSSVCSPPLSVLPCFQGYGGHSLASSGAGLGVELFSSAFYKLCVCSKCRNGSKIFCSVLT